MTAWHLHPSPLGELLLIGDGEALTHLYLREHEQTVASLHADRDAAPFAEVCRQLDAYFAGRLRTFGAPLRPAGTDFQRRVWDRLAHIPFGQTRSYLDVARAIGNPAAVRAVGAANGANPISIVIPCHRVIAASGALHGYGGGLTNKRWLLDHEAQHAGATLLTA